MKKIAVALVAFAFMASFNAQAQGKKNLDSGSYSSEKLNLWSTNVAFNPFGSGSSDVFELDNLQIRRYLNDNAALRLSLGVSLYNNKYTSTNDYDDPTIDKSDKSNYYDITHQTDETISRSKSFSIGVGYEYHRDIFDNVDMYVGGEIGYTGYFISATSKTDQDEEEWSPYSNTKTETTTSSTTEYFKWDGSSNTNHHDFYIAGLAGVDVYFYKNLYIGAELGLIYTLSYYKNGYYENNSESTKKVTSGSTTTVSTTTDEYSSRGSSSENKYYNSPGTTVDSWKDVYHDLGLFIEPSFHIGIRF